MEKRVLMLENRNQICNENQRHCAMMSVFFKIAWVSGDKGKDTNVITRGTTSNCKYENRNRNRNIHKKAKIQIGRNRSVTDRSQGN